MQSKKIKIEGYWWSKQEPEYPMPIKSDIPFDNKDVVVKKLVSLQAKISKRYYKGFSTCRCCGERNGTAEYSHKGWKWPEGLIHYIIEHNIEPSLQFKKEILNM